jgi:GDP-mannose 6-dehydrogenase
MRIGILGLGYVGIVNVACLSKQGFTVLCNDVKTQKVERVKKGESPINEPEVGQLIKAGLENGTIIPMDDPTELIKQSDIIITCVGTPSRPDGEVNLDYLKNVCSDIARSVGKGDKKYVVFRSTVPPGTTEKVLATHLSQTEAEITPVFYPEFLREGSAVRDFYDYGRFVLGKREEDDVTDLIEVLHVNKERPSFITDLRTAEYSKYIDNSFHALKIVFANEIFSLAKEHGVNIKDSHAIFTADDKLNISKRYLRPGLPFGGSCLPKDLRELQHLIGQSDRDFSLLPSLIPSNDAFIASLLDKVKSKNKSKLAFIGLSFKNDSDDLRESPMLRLLEELRKDRSYQIHIHDADLQLGTLRVDYPHLYSMVKSLEDCVETAELLIVSKRYLESVLPLKKAGQPILNFSDAQYISDPEVDSLYS